MQSHITIGLRDQTLETAPTAQANMESAKGSGMLASAAVAGGAALAASVATAPAHAAFSLAATPKPTTIHEAWRFLTQATFGPKPAEVLRNSSGGNPSTLLFQQGYAAWLDDQFTKMPKQSTYQLTLSMNGAYRIAQSYTPAGGLITQPVKMGGNNSSFTDIGMISSVLWQQFVTGEDQLRQRVAYELSQIFVVSFRDGDLKERALMVANYHDILVRGAFGSFRSLIENICRSPAMGHYLSHIRNLNPQFVAPESEFSNKEMKRIPDQNFARELMQLFTIGLIKLKMDGTPDLNADGDFQETYLPKDIQRLSFVFTGWSLWSAPGNCGTDPNVCASFWPDAPNSDASRWSYANKPMIGYNMYHAKPKDFARILDLPNPGSGSVAVPFLDSSFTVNGDCVSDMKAALDVIFAHQNIAPFLSKQLIQRLVTSNPSRFYVQRVAEQFKSSNFSLRTLVRAIFLDPEARDPSIAANSKKFGKLRDPVLRVTAALRGLKTDAHKSLTNPAALAYQVPATYETAYGGYALGQGPYQAPSVFNFFRPGYIERNTETGRRNLVAPELQIATGVDIAAYTTVVACVLHGGGFGADVLGVNAAKVPPLFAYNSTYVLPSDRPARGVEIDFNHELGLLVVNSQQNVPAYIDTLSDRFFGGQMVNSLRNKIQQLFDAPINLSDVDKRLYKIQISLFMCLVSAQFAIQK